MFSPTEHPDILTLLLQLFISSGVSFIFCFYLPVLRMSNWWSVTNLLFSQNYNCLKNHWILDSWQEHTAVVLLYSNIWLVWPTTMTFYVCHGVPRSVSSMTTYSKRMSTSSYASLIYASATPRGCLRATKRGQPPKLAWLSPWLPQWPYWTTTTPASSRSASAWCGWARAWAPWRWRWCATQVPVALSSCHTTPSQALPRLETTTRMPEESWSSPTTRPRESGFPDTFLLFLGKLSSKRTKTEGSIDISFKIPPCSSSLFFLLLYSTILIPFTFLLIYSLFFLTSSTLSIP